MCHYLRKNNFFSRPSTSQSNRSSTPASIETLRAAVSGGSTTTTPKPATSAPAPTPPSSKPPSATAGTVNRRYKLDEQ